MKLHTLTFCFSFKKLHNFVELSIVFGYFLKIRSTEVCLVHCQTFLMELLTKIVNYFSLVTAFAKRFVIAVLQGPKCSSGVYRAYNFDKNCVTKTFHEC